jgi:tRNA 2-thiouridine synthesizing protein A
MPHGALLTVVATDPATVLDLPAWARMRGHETVSSQSSPDEVRVTLRLTGQTSSASSR